MRLDRLEDWLSKIWPESGRLWGEYQIIPSELNKTRYTELKLLAQSNQIKLLTEDDFTKVNFPFKIFESDNLMLGKNHAHLEQIDYFSFFDFNNLKNSQVLIKAQLASLNSKIIHDQGKKGSRRK